MTSRAAHRERTTLDLVAGALAAIARDRVRDTIAVVSVPAPAPAIGAFCCDNGIAWRAPGMQPIVGGGEALTIAARGHGRFAEIRHRADALWPRVVHRRVADVPAPPPRLWGGLAFAPGAADAEPWHEFGDARFALPVWTASSLGDRGWLSIACVDPADPAARRRALDTVDRLLAGLGREPEAGAPGIASRRDLDRESWRCQVEAIVADIAAGHSDKIVAARRSVIELARAADPRAITARLAADHPGCTVFAFCRPGTALVGATPERLIARRGDRVSTYALAGTIAADAPDAASRLAASAKDRSEQSLVVGAIASVLAPLCAELEVPASPSVRSLRGLHHLETAITGRLARAVHVLELARALHPTPAVGGLPRERAQAWIARAEHAPRGWYGSPIGWFDASGDGELVVALRCGVVAGRRAHLFSGAGIVAGSDADAEYAETELKQRPLIDALEGRRGRDEDEAP